MKILIFISTLVLSTSVLAANKRSVLNWNPNIPTSPSKVIDIVKAEAGYFSYETDDGACGGEVTNSQLLDYSSHTTEDGNQVHELVIRFQVSKAENYCESESEVTCEVPFQVLSENGIVMGAWSCEK